MAVWGKSDREDETNWLPLVQHLTDAAAVAQQVWDEWLPGNVKHVIEGSLPTGARDGRVLVAWLAGSHDVGKASPTFSCQVEHLADRMRPHGAKLPVGQLSSGDRRLGRHATVGQVAVAEWLKMRHDAQPRVRQSYASVVGSHHGQPPRPDELTALGQRPHLLGEGVWADVRTEILENIAVLSGAQDYLSSWCRHTLATEAQMLTTAVVVVSDWIASDESRFPYVNGVRDSETRLRAAWEDLGLPGPWHSPAGSMSTDALMSARFPALRGASANPVQRACHQIADQVDGPGLMIVEAPMGHGKTEAALMAIERLASRFDLGGAFVGLPTMATSDAMFERVLDWIGQLPGDGATSTFLAHSKAALNEEYAGLLRAPEVSGIHDEQEEAGEGGRSGRAVATAVSWLTGRRKGMLANFVVGTVDQVLFGALAAKYVMLRHLGLSGKVVVVDEVHAADDYMRMYLCRALEWLARYGVPVVLLSATLPRYQTQEILEAYEKGLGCESWSIGESPEGYPLVTTADASGVGYHPVTPPVDVDIRLDVLSDDLDALVSELDHSLRDGGCVAVVRNTVARAQETYLLLRARFGDDVRLLHSRFLAPERTARESALRQQLGRDGSRPHRLIVVGTQVLEQSLDVDFDLMVTDVAPVDLVLQRLGRLHRHPREHRPGPVAVPRVLVTGISQWSADGPQFDPGVRAIYGEARLLRCLGALGLHEHDVSVEIAMPGDIRRLVEMAYADGATVPVHWAGRQQQSDEQWRQAIAQARERATGFRLQEPPAPRLPVSLGDLFSSVGDDQEQQGRAAVRDGEDAVEVIVVRRREGELRTMPGPGRFDDVQLQEFHGEPDRAVARSLAATTVRLPGFMCQPWNIDRVIEALEAMGFANWQTSPWLRGQLVLVLDDELTAQVEEFSLTYDHDLGLTVEKGAAP